ncbi:MAG: IPT/TIG domain-containing protein [Acidithiobacillus ferrivorans]
MLDQVAPTITGTWPDANNPVTWSSGTIFVGYNDPVPSSGISISQSQITLDGNALSGCSDTGTSISCPVSGLNPAPHTIGGRVADDSGNSSNVNSTFYVQGNVPPVVSYSGPSGPVNANAVTVAASFNAQASVSGVNASSATLSLNGGSASACSVSGNNIACPASALADGSYNAVVSIADNAGDVGSAAGSFAVDTTAPAISNLSPSGHILTQTATIGANISDLGSGINLSTLTVSLDGAALSGCSVTSGVVSCPTGALNSGLHNYVVSVSDNAGNITSAPGSFSYGTYQIIAPSGGLFIIGRIWKLARKWDLKSNEFRQAKNCRCTSCACRRASRSPH